MSTRKFLGPLALSVAALLSVNTADASVVAPKTPVEVVAPQVTETPSVQASDFILKPAASAQSSNSELAWHYSHSSHASHSSHSSHYSSRY